MDVTQTIKADNKTWPSLPKILPSPLTAKHTLMGPEDKPQLELFFELVYGTRHSFGTKALTQMYEVIGSY